MRCLPQVLLSPLFHPSSKCTTRTLTFLCPWRSPRWWPNPLGRAPPPSRSSTLGLNDARFRGRWAGRPPSFETAVEGVSRCDTVAQFFHPAASLLPTPNPEGGNLRSPGSASFCMALLPLYVFTQTWKFRWRGGKGRLTWSCCCFCGDNGLSGRRTNKRLLREQWA